MNRTNRVVLLATVLIALFATSFSVFAGCNRTSIVGAYRFQEDNNTVGTLLFRHKDSVVQKVVYEWQGDQLGQVLVDTGTWEFVNKCAVKVNWREDKKRFPRDSEHENTEHNVKGLYFFSQIHEGSDGKSHVNSGFWSHGSFTRGLVK